MKVIIFAGGIGTRMWPLSRRNSPKQFDKFFDGKSTLELAYDRAKKRFALEDIYVQTGESFASKVKEDLPEMKEGNLIIEPARRDLGAAVCYAVKNIISEGYAGSMAILWADHIMKNEDNFVETLQLAEKLINEDKDRFVFLGEKPRFANNNLGWIKIGGKVGEVEGVSYYNFGGWKYKPEQGECDRMFASGGYLWNPGYFVTSTSFLLAKYQELAPDIYNKVFGDKYRESEKVSFDNAIIEKLPKESAVVLKTDMGWSDPGTLYALKEALAKTEDENIEEGTVVSYDSKDSLLYNTDNDKLVAGVGLKGMVVVNTKDALIVTPKERVKEVTDLIRQMEGDEGLHKFL